MCYQRVKGKEKSLSLLPYHDFPTVSTTSQIIFSFHSFRIYFNFAIVNKCLHFPSSPKYYSHDVVHCVCLRDCHALTNVLTTIHCFLMIKRRKLRIDSFAGKQKFRHCFSLIWYYRQHFPRCLTQHFLGLWGNKPPMAGGSRLNTAARRRKSSDERVCRN